MGLILGHHLPGKDMRPTKWSILKVVGSCIGVGPIHTCMYSLVQYMFAAYVSLGSKSESTLYYLLRIQDEDGVTVSVEGGR